VNEFLKVFFLHNLLHVPRTDTNSMLAKNPTKSPVKLKHNKYYTRK